MYYNNSYFKKILLTLKVTTRALGFLIDGPAET